MSWRRIAITYGLAAVFGLYIYTVESMRGGQVTIAVKAADPILPILASRVTDVAVKWTDSVVQLRRDGERWTVVRPVGAEVTSDLVTAIIDTLSTIAPIEVISERDEDGDTDEYGLASPGVQLHIEGDDKQIDLFLGARNPTRTAVYARTSDDDRIYLLGLAADYYVQLLFEELDSARGL